jgi:hypothetical protein
MLLGKTDTPCRRAGTRRWLLAHDADRNARNKRGKTAAEIGRAHAAIVRLLTKS